jgi:uncharacterized peroxidase-related enzyme
MFLHEAPQSDAAAAEFARDRDEDGYVHNYRRLWAWRPGLCDSFAELRGRLMDESTLTELDQTVLVTATVSHLGDSYCSLAWAPELVELTDEGTAVQLLAGRPAPRLTARSAALCAWARKVVDDPNSTTDEDVERLRSVGLGDREIFEATALIAFRLAFSTVNDALGAVPDGQLAAEVPEPVRAAVTFGRSPSPPGP